MRRSLILVVRYLGKEMGIFDWFKKSKPRPTLEKLCYDIAYLILPTHAHTQFRVLLDLLKTSPEATGGLYYHLVCKSHKIEGDPGTSELFRWHQGKLDETHIYAVLEYPQPTPIDLTDVPPDVAMQNVGTWTIAPYFSAIVRDQTNGNIQYFVLGQTSMGGGTVLRCVDNVGTNYNLGAGPEPTLDALLSAVREHIEPST